MILGARYQGWRHAVEKENARLVELLLNYNIDPNFKCKAGWTPFSRAIEEGSAAVVKALLSGGIRIDSSYQLVSM
jgi:ankyrin repeat protein